jgi:hypothetical protein
VVHILVCSIFGLVPQECLASIYKLPAWECARPSVRRFSIPLWTTIGRFRLDKPGTDFYMRVINAGVAAASSFAAIETSQSEGTTKVLTARILRSADKK